MKNLNEKTFDLLESTGLNWTVSKQQLFTGNGTPTESYGIIKRHLYKDETPKWLGTVGNQYVPYQNFELAETLIQATDEMNISLNRGGSLCGDKKIYLQAQIADEYIGKSEIKRYITALNSHDGSTSIGFGSSNTVVICQNTFFKAHKEVSKFRHTISAADRAKLAVADLRRTLELDNKLMDGFKRMADLDMKDEVVERVLNSIFALDKVKGRDELSTRKENQMKDFSGALVREVEDEGKTVWALFNAVTRYTNHITAPKEADKKLDYLMTGGGYDINLKAFDTVMKWVQENSHQYVMVGA